MGKITINDISREAGVSIATVSRVLNRKNNVSREAEARVLEAARRLEYPIPSAPAARPRLIAVVVPRLSNPFYNDILDGIQDVAARYRYNTIISQTKSESGYSADPPGFLCGDIADGLITMEHAFNLREMLHGIDPALPVVQCCEYDEELPYPYVAIDDYTAAYNAVSYLGTTGRRRIAFFNSSTRYLYGKKREEGYLEALRNLNLPIEKALIYHLNIIDLHVAYSAALKILSLPPDVRPDAIFAVSDIYAIAVTRAARKLGLSIPRDIAVIGFDNIEIAAMNEPPITTVSQPRYEIGVAAANTLFGIVKQRPPMSRELLLGSELVVRGST